MSQKELLETALLAQKHSHSPYSKMKVGAAIKLSNGKIYQGCNIENASFGGTVCAERVALWKAVSEESLPITVSDILVVTDAQPAWPPCGFCRQVMAEFCSPQTKIHIANPRGVEKTTTLGDLLPESFTPTHLKK